MGILRFPNFFTASDALLISPFAICHLPFAIVAGLSPGASCRYHHADWQNEVGRVCPQAGGAGTKKSDVAGAFATLWRCMKKNTPNNVTYPFVARHEADVMGILSGFDRLRVRGTLRSLYQPRVLLRYLYLCQVLLKGFKAYSLDLTGRILQRAEQMARAAKRPWLYVGSTRTSKEELARQISREEHIQRGLIGILRCVEPCQTYEVRGITPVLKTAKCMHLYFYQQHPRWGFMHLRLQTWFPFQIEVCLNGREWLSRQLDRAHIAYERQDNYLAWIQDVPRAQALMDRQCKMQWPRALGRLLDQCHPLHREICRPLDWQYYWSCCESEFATDVMFKDPERLARLYPRLTQHALLSFGSREVLRFLGRKVPLSGKSRFAGEVLSDLQSRPEGLRVKHRVGRNTLKMYDKFGRGLRVETTINACEDFQVYRRPEGQPQSAKAWRALRRGLADLPRRAEISRAANTRYLHALAAVEETQPLNQLVQGLCGPVRYKGRRWRALNPWSAQDGVLLEAINRGEFVLNGLRNRDLRPLLYPEGASTKEQRRQAARVSRRLALLRAHGILKKVPHSHRYQLTQRGRIIVTALLTARQANIKQLEQLAA